MSVRTQIANQLNTGRMVAAIATDLGLSQQSVYRLKKKFQQGDGTFVAAPASVATKQAFSRAQLVEISQWLEAEPKLTLAELRQKAVAEGWYTSLDKVPDASTLWRQLNKLGFKWRSFSFWLLQSGWLGSGSPCAAWLVPDVEVALVDAEESGRVEPVVLCHSKRAPLELND